MSAFSLTGWDAFAVAIILISSIMAFARGLIREVFSIVAFVGAGFAALFLTPLIGPFTKNFIQPALIAYILTALVVFLGVFIIVVVATSSLAKTLHKSGEIGALDRIAGLLFGAGRAIALLAGLILVIQHVTGPTVPMPDSITKARTYPVLNQIASAIDGFIPKARDYINERRKTESAAPPS